MANLGPRLKRARVQQGLTQEQVAAKLHMSQATICNWEQGKGGPDAKELKKLEGILGKFDGPSRKAGDES